MKKMIAVAVLAVVATSAMAGSGKVMLPIAGAMEANDAQAKLNNGVKFFFAGQATPKILSKLGEKKTSQKTNAFGKSAETACNWAFLSAMMHLEKQAVALGANAVVNIVSNYNNVPTASATEFECHEGALMAGVAFKGDFVRIEK